MYYSEEMNKGRLKHHVMTHSKEAIKDYRVQKCYLDANLKKLLLSERWNNLSSKVLTMLKSIR